MGFRLLRHPRVSTAFATVGGLLLLQAAWASPAHSQPSINVYRAARDAGLALTRHATIDNDTSSPSAQTFEGTLLIVWGDPHASLGSGGETRYALALADGSGRILPLQLTGQENVAVTYFNKPVMVSGRVAAGPSAITATGSMEAFVVDAIAPGLSLQTQPQAAATFGTKRVIFLLVKFADDAAVPHPPSFYTDLTNPDAPPPGAAFPATVNGFFKKTSWNQFHWLADVGGVGGVGAPGGWLTLPHPRSYYANCGWSSACAKLWDLGNDAILLGKAQGIAFTNYDNINFVLSNDLDCCAWGGSYGLDGKSYGATWEPPWGQETGTYVHEMGHSIGLPHSGWVYYAYDSPWDMMSARMSGSASTVCGSYFSANSGNPATLGCSEPGDGYIAGHKDFLGWIPDANMVVTDTSSIGAVTLEGDALPLGSVAKMVKICIPGFPCTGSAARYFTVEARVKGQGTASQFDNGIPGEGVVIHEFRFDRPAIGGPCFFNSASGWAVPVDSTPGDFDSVACDAGGRSYPDFALFNAQLEPGQSYTNTAYGLRIVVLGRTGSTFLVSYGSEIRAGGPVVLTAENAVPPNGVPDPGETVTASFPLINLGTIATTSLVATLQAGGGVTKPSAAQSYGALAGGGPAVARPFSFTAAGACGDTITATLALRDGAADLGTISFPLTLGVTQIGPPQSFANATPIMIPANQASFDPGVANPYPSSITVSGLPGVTHSLSVSLNDFNHTFPYDVSALLVSPTGQKMIVMSRAGGDRSVVGADLILDDAAASGLPDGSSAGVVSGTFRPTSFDYAPAFDSPAPGAPYPNPAPAGTDTLNAVFAGNSPNGAWNLYAIDDAYGDNGRFGGGWKITIASRSSSCSAVGTPGPPTEVNATAGNGYASVSFAAPANDGGSPITGYTATCTPTTGVPGTAPGPGSPIVVPALTNGVTYICTVHATNGVGSGEESSPTNPVTPVAPPATLTVVLSGSGSGVVASDVPGIACPSDCAETYLAGTPVVLTSTATAGSVFTGWLGGGCTGTSVTCNVTVNTATTVSATFAAPGTVVTVDIDLSAPGTKYDAGTDGLLIIRYLLGLAGPTLTTSALGRTATRTDSEAIKAYFDAVRPALDIDGNGTADALTDGLLILRYQFGLRGDALIAGAVDPMGTRTTAAEIEAYLQNLMP